MTRDHAEAPKLSLDAFCAALSSHLKEPVTPDSEIVSGLSIFGDDFDYLLFHLKEKLGLEFKPGVDLSGRMAGEPHLFRLIGNLASYLQGKHRGSIFMSPTSSYSVRDLYEQLRVIGRTPGQAG